MKYKDMPIQEEFLAKVCIDMQKIIRDGNVLLVKQTKPIMNAAAHSKNNATS